MRKLLIFATLFLLHVVNAQNVFLTKVNKTHENTDKFLYRIQVKIESAEYLGEVEVQGFSKNDPEIFSLIYKKAKEIGANTFAINPYENIDGTTVEFNPAHYRFNLYYLPKEKLVEQTGRVYVFASSEKDQKISINKNDYVLSPRSYVVMNTIPGEVYTISTRKLLGSAVKLQPKADQQNQYFQISATKVKSDETGVGGLNLKSGDIIGLEKSYAEFLSTIYNKEKQSQ